MDKEKLYRTLHRMGRYHFMYIHQKFEAIGIHPGQPFVLLALYEKGEMAQKDLAEKIFIKPSTMTVTLKRLEKENLVTRRCDDQDHRVMRVTLTMEGKDKCELIKRVLRDAEEDLFNGFSDEALQDLEKSFIQMIDNIKERKGDHENRN